MRISDWSSDVCSSDLLCLWGRPEAQGLPVEGRRSAHAHDRPRPRAGAAGGVGAAALCLSLSARRSGDSADGRGAGDALSGHSLPACIAVRSEEHTSELQSLMRISYAVFCLKKKKNNDELKIMYITL